MAIQICPKCKAESFNWHMADDDIITNWYCYICNYSATEDEQAERECSRCGIKTESLLKDDKQEYWWCFKCQQATKQKEAQ